jgi:malonyl-ACP decarboxylase
MSGNRVFITGAGIVSPLGAGLRAFAERIFSAETWFRTARTAAGEVIPVARITDESAELPEKARKLARRSARAVGPTVASALEAWEGGDADGTPTPERTGLIVAGSNLNSSYSFEQSKVFERNPWHLLPSYALHYLDSDYVGLLSEFLGISGGGYTVGASSASGAVALLDAMRQVRAGYWDACLVVSPMADLSPVELQAFQGLGALAGKRFGNEPSCASRPFDRDREGFVPGEASAGILLESEASAWERSAKTLGEFLGGAVRLSASRSPQPCGEAEFRAMVAALGDAHVPATHIDYVNAHATSSVAGDETELRALEDVFGSHASKLWVNSTKGITGHCLHAAGVVELIAVLVQMHQGRVHPNRNLENPIDTRCQLVKATAEAATIRLAMSNSFGFGGINSSLVIGGYSA